MNSPTTSIFLFAAIFLGMMIQLIVNWLNRSGHTTSYKLFRSGLIVYWLVVAASFVWFGWGLIANEPSGGAGIIVLGTGLALAGIGSALARKWISGLGGIIVAAGSMVMAYATIQSGQILAGVMALIMGVGIVAARMPMPVSGVSQMLVGALMAASAGVLLAVQFASQPIVPLTTGLGVVMAGMGLFTLAGGVRSLVAAAKPAEAPSQA